MLFVVQQQTFFKWRCRRSCFRSNMCWRSVEQQGNYRIWVLNVSVVLLFTSCKIKIFLFNFFFHWKENGKVSSTNGVNLKGHAFEFDPVVKTTLGAI